MSLTLLAIILMPFFLKLVLDPQMAHKGMKEVVKSPALNIFGAGFHFILALMIFSETKLQFSFDLESLLSWLGLIIFIKGIFCLIPNLTESCINKCKAKHLPVFGLIGLIFSLILIYLDFKILA